MMLQQSSVSRASFPTATLREAPFVASRPQRGSLQVSNALSRPKKAEIVTDLKAALDSSLIVFGMRFKHLPVQTMQRFRKQLPESTKVFICKNNLMRVATQQTEGWSSLAEKGCSGENAWVFMQEEGAAATIKAYFKFEEDLFVEAKKVAAKGAEVKRPTEVAVAVMDNRYMSPAELKKCESLPTKKELIATIARLVKTPARQIASTVKQVPTKLALAIKLASELDEDKTKTLAQVMVA